MNKNMVIKIRKNFGTQQMNKTFKLITSEES